MQRVRRATGPVEGGGPGAAGQDGGLVFSGMPGGTGGGRGSFLCVLSGPRLVLSGMPGGQRVALLR